MVLHTSTHALCKLFYQNKPSITNTLLDMNCIDIILREMLATDPMTRMTILGTLQHLSSQNRRFIQKWTSVHSALIYDAFKLYPECANPLYAIALNTFNHEDIGIYALPMLSITKMKSIKAFRFFLKLLTGKQNPTKMDPHIFNDLNDLLLDVNAGSIVQHALCNIFTVNYGVVKSTKLDIWKSKCRETLIHIASNDIQSASNISQSQSLVLNMTFNAYHSLCFNKYALNENEIKHIILSLNHRNTFRFGIHMLSYHKFQMKNTEIILSRLCSIQKENDEKEINFQIFCLIFDLRNSTTITENVINIMKDLAPTCFTEALVEHIETLHELKSAIEFLQKISVSTRKLNEKYEGLSKKQELQEFLQNKGISLHLPDDFKCPITQEVMKEPIVASDGFSYEKSALMQLFKNGNKKSPLTRERLNDMILVPNTNLKKRIRDYEEDICKIVAQRLS